MCNILERLPVELVGFNVLGYLKLSDLVLLERSSARRELRELFLYLIPYAPPLDLSKNQHQNASLLSWIMKRRLRVRFLRIKLPGNNPVLNMNNILVENVELRLSHGVTQEDFKHFQGSSLRNKISIICISADMNKEVITHICSCIDYVNKLHIRNCSNSDEWLTSNILEKWNLQDVSIDRCINMSIDPLISSFSEVTSLTFHDTTMDDTTVLAIAQHCLKLRRLHLYSFDLTVASLLALSEQKLPLEWLDIPIIPIIPTANVARRCSHALSCMDSLSIGLTLNYEPNAPLCIPYLTEIKWLYLNVAKFAYMDKLIKHCTKLECISAVIGMCSTANLL